MSSPGANPEQWVVPLSAVMRDFTEEQAQQVQMLIDNSIMPLRGEILDLINQIRLANSRFNRTTETVDGLRAEVTALQNRDRDGLTNLEVEIRQLRTDVNRLLELNTTGVATQNITAITDRLTVLEGIILNPPPEVPVRPPSEPIAPKSEPIDVDEETGIIPEDNMGKDPKKKREDRKKKSQKGKKNRKNSGDPSDGSDSSTSDDSDTNSSSSISADESDDSDDESRDERGGVFNRKKRSDCRKLKAIKPSDREYRKLVDYRYYRLKNRSQKRSGKETKEVRKQIQKLEVTMKERKFDGADKIKVLSFLARFVREADLIGMSEAQAVLAFPHFLKGNASTRYEAANSVESWPETVQYLLQTYATEAVIQEANADLRNIRQKSGEAEVEYDNRLTEAELRCGNVHKWDERKLRFIDGLLPVIKPLVARYNRSDRKATYWDVVEYAQSEGEALRARGGTRKSDAIPTASGARPTQRRVYLMDTPSGSATHRGSRSDRSQGSGEVYLLAEDGETGSDPTYGTTTTTTVETIDATQMEQSAEDQVMLTGGYRKPQWARPQSVPFGNRDMRQSRPGWIDNRNNPGQSRGNQPQANPIRIFCYTCYQEGHTSPECPGQVTAETVIRNYESLPREILRVVPAGSYWKARDEKDAQGSAGTPQFNARNALPPPRPAEVHPNRLPKQPVGETTGQTQKKE